MTVTGLLFLVVLASLAAAAAGGAIVLARRDGYGARQREPRRAADERR